MFVHTYMYWYMYASHLHLYMYMYMYLLSTLQGHVDCEGPNRRLYEFVGNLTVGLGASGRYVYMHIDTCTYMYVNVGVFANPDNSCLLINAVIYTKPREMGDPFKKKLVTKINYIFAEVEINYHMYCMYMCTQVV